MQKIALVLCLFLGTTPKIAETNNWKVETKRGYLAVPFWDANANHQSFVIRQDLTKWVLPIYYLLVPNEEVYEKLFNLRGLLVEVEVVTVYGGESPHYIAVGAYEVKEQK